MRFNISVTVDVGSEDMQSIGEAVSEIVHAKSAADAASEKTRMAPVLEAIGLGLTWLENERRRSREDAERFRREREEAEAQNRKQN